LEGKHISKAQVGDETGVTIDKCDAEERGNFDLSLLENKFKAFDEE
jgi:hypothetical protein